MVRLIRIELDLKDCVLAAGRSSESGSGLCRISRSGLRGRIMVWTSSSSCFSCSSLLLLLLTSSLDWLPVSTFSMEDDHVMSSPAPGDPHITECISRDQETFWCGWSPGSDQNLWTPGALRFFYLKKSPSSSEWRECPEYVHSQRECFFDVNHTSVWMTYCMALRGQNNVTYFNDNDCFTVENIVRPDPPVSLNWSLLNVSPSGLSYDVTVTWESPPSADVSTGWMRIEYEIQYRERNSTNWEALEITRQTHQTVYGLHIGNEYDLHIRCRMQGFTKFGEFSNSIVIQVTEIPNQESTFPLTLVVVIGIVGVLILIMMFVISQQHRLMMILLPPVPAPKIKGIDPELLKKGKLDELNFILSCGGMGGLPTITPHFYQDEPWVEFIEVEEDKEEQQGSDTQRLLELSGPHPHHQLGLSGPPNHHLNTGCSNTISLPDDDSSQASCYDPDVADEEALKVTLLPGQPNHRETVQTPPGGSLVQTPPGGPQTWVSTDFYAQVSNVMPSGGVVLSPGQQPRTQDGSSEDGVGLREKNQQQLQLLVVDPEGGGYTSENRQVPPPDSPPSGQGYHIIDPPPLENKQSAPAEENQSPYILPDSSQIQVFAPVADYTLVQEVDAQHSLLLNPCPPQSPPPCQAQHPLKALPAMPVGYVTPDLLGNLSP